MTFLEKYELLKKSIPVPAIMADNSLDCDYGDGNVYCKNCYYAFEGYYLENNMYTSFGAYNKTIVDCDGMYESEKCYESIDGTKCHSCTYLIDCNSSNDCHFSAYLNSCSDCFGCVALTHKSIVSSMNNLPKKNTLKELKS